MAHKKVCRFYKSLLQMPETITGGFFPAPRLSITAGGIITPVAVLPADKSVILNLCLLF